MTRVDVAASAGRPPWDYRFTVLTPTYDRAHTLPRVYTSLQSQTFTDFEWLIVDDGSSDGTGDLIREWQAASSLVIRYLFQPNGGKHVAFNRGVLRARGELLLTLDSDDECSPIALEHLWGHWQRIPAERRDWYVGVTALCQDQHGRVVGDRFPADVFDSNPAELFYRYRVGGEKWGFSRTSVLREFPFPTPRGASFVPESVVWDAIGAEYQTRYVNEVLRTYWIREDSGRHRPTLGQLRKMAPGMADWHAMVLDNHLRWFRYSPARLLASAVHYGRFSALAGRGPLEQLRRLHRPLARLLWAVTIPISLLVFGRDIRRSGSVDDEKRQPMA